MIPACDQKHCTPPTTTACAVMMRSGYNNGGLLGVSRCSVYVMNSLILLEYTDCFLWYLVFVSNFGVCYICTVSYRIVLRAYRDTYLSLCIGDIPVCRCIVSALVQYMALSYWSQVQKNLETWQTICATSSANWHWHEWWYEFWRGGVFKYIDAVLLAQENPSWR